MQFTPAYVYDKLANLLSGIGTAKDKTLHSLFFFKPLTQTELESAYRGDWVCRKTVDIPAEDATREWRAWQADEKEIEKIEKVERDHDIPGKLRDAMVAGRLFGGGALILGIDGAGEPDQELIVEDVKQDSLKFVHAVTRHELTPGPVQDNVLEPFYGEPQYYERNNGAVGTRIHPSRVVRLLGNKYPNRPTAPDTWSDPILQAVDDALRSVGIVTGGITALVHEMKMDIIRVPNLTNALTNEKATAKLVERFSTANAYKSNINALLIDKDEEWQRLQVQFAGVPDLIKIFLMIAAAASDIPATRYLGQSPAGLSATGESDLRNYYDSVKSHQTRIITPAVSRLDEVLIRSATGTRDETIYYLWNSLWQMQPKEKAEIEKLKAETFKIDWDTGALSSNGLEIARKNQLVELGAYPDFAGAMDEGEKLDESDPHPGDPEVKAQLAAEQALAAGQVNPDGTPMKGKPKVDPKTGKPALRLVAKDAKPRTLYVRRDVVNTAAIYKWAKEQGFDKPVDNLHVTLAYSKTPLDWMKIGEDWYGPESGDGRYTIPPGGARLVEPLGDEGAIVLLFNSSRLAWRHESLKEAGAGWDFDSYQPHIAITYKGRVDLAKVVPYRGEIILGPEIWEELKRDGAPEPGDR